MIDPAVRACWAAFSTPIEGCESGLYLDEKGYPTTAVGCLVARLADSLRLPWRTAAGDLADDDTITAEYQRISAMLPDRLPHYYAPTLHLDADAIRNVVGQRLDWAALGLSKILLLDFASLPAPIQAWALSVAWAAGANWPTTWPHARGAVLAGDWPALLAPEPGQRHPDGRPKLVCDLDERGNPGLAPRNMAGNVLVQLAAGVSVAEALAGIPAGPSGDAARKALAALPFCQVASATLPTH